MTESEIIQSIRAEYTGLRGGAQSSLANSAKILADDLYAKDTHFLFELIQNAEDNEYAPEVSPNLRFSLETREIEGVQERVLIVHNNETGFIEQHVRAICRIGDSTKQKVEGYIGEKGIGFKSVFRVTKCPYIFSNGFQFCLPDYDEDTGLRYIVPRWVMQPPADCVVADETTILLPVNKDDKAFDTVSRALRDIAPETILFLRKLHALEIYVRITDDEDEYEIVIEKSVQRVMQRSSLVELTYLKRSKGSTDLLETSLYWVTTIEFDRPDVAAHEKRKGITSRPVSVAIPLSQQSDKNPFQGKLFAYLPVWQETGLPFIMNADFLLVSSREGIQEDLAWNKWLRDCIAETYQVAFADLLNSSELSVEQKVAAYGSIPLDSNIGFLRPVVREIQKRLSEMDCVMVLPDRSLARPQQARHCPQTYRMLFAPDDDLPSSLLTNTRLTCPELDPYVKQIKAIGVKTLQDDEALSPLIDHDWVCRRPISWFVKLVRYLSMQKYDSSDLRKLGIVPISFDGTNRVRLASPAVQPIYFCGASDDSDAIVEVPDWLREFVNVAFVSTEFLELVERQDDGQKLKEWLKERLSIREFSTAQFCTDLLATLIQSYKEIEAAKLLDSTEFLVKYAKEGLDWQNIPVILSDGQRLLLKDAKSSYRKKTVVVPENYDVHSGWQHIWQSNQRQHFLAMHIMYPISVVAELVSKANVCKYPPPPIFEYSGGDTGYSFRNLRDVLILMSEYERNCLSQIGNYSHLTSIHNYRAPSVLSSDSLISEEVSRSLLAWIASSDISSYRFCQIDYFYYRKKDREFDSEFLTVLKRACWLPSTHGRVRPSDAFIKKASITEVFDDTVPYLEGQLPDQVIRLLGIRTDVTVQELVSLLRDASSRTNISTDFVTRIYTQLNARPLPPEVKGIFVSEALIFVKGRDGSPRWCKKDECVWEDASPILGDSFAYLSNHYPKLQAFFVEQLGVKRSVDKESYAQRWLQLQEEPVGKIDERRKVVERLYQEMSSVVKTSPQPGWWSNFARRAKIYTQSDKFVAPKDAVLPDDGKLRDIFRDSGVEYAWRPEKDAFSDWELFYVALGTPVLSASVEQQIVGSIDYQALPANRFVTPAAIQMISAWLREKRKDKFQSLIEGNVFQELINIQEAEISSEIQVLFRLKVGWPQPSTTVTYPVFWDHSRKVLLYGQNPDKSIIAKTIAKGLLAGQVDKDLAHWIELVLEASDTNRLKHENWSVPKQILDLFSVLRSTPVPSPKEIDVVPGAEPLLTPALSVNSVATQTALTSDHDDLEEFGALSIDIQSHSEKHGLTSTMGKVLPRIDGASKSVQSVQSGYTPKLKIRHQDGITSASEISYGGEGDTGTESLLYPDALTAAFDQPGKTRFEDDDMTPPVSSVPIVKNPQRRAQKLAEEMRHNINREPSIEDRCYTTERNILEAPNEQVRMALLEWYNGKCQICDDTWPKRDGEPFFVAAYLVERQHARWLDNPGNALCLCAKHFAQWRLAAKTAPLDIIEQIQSLRLRSEGGNGDLSILFTLLNDDIAIRYDERHFLALRTLIEVASEHPSATSVAPVGEANYAD